jgi:hypothetical protein
MCRTYFPNVQGLQYVKSRGNHCAGHIIFPTGQGLQYVKSRGNHCAGHIFSQRAGFAVPEEQGESLCRTLIYTMGVAVREVRGKSLVQDISIAHWAGFAVCKV